MPVRSSRTSCRCCGSASIHWFSRSKSLNSSVAFSSSVSCFSCCASRAYQLSTRFASASLICFFTLSAFGALAIAPLALCIGMALFRSA